MVEIKQGTAYAVPCFGAHYKLGRLPQTPTKGLFVKSPLESQKLSKNKMVCLREVLWLTFLSRKVIFYLSFWKGGSSFINPSFMFSSMSDTTVSHMAGSPSLTGAMRFIISSFDTPPANHVPPLLRQLERNG